MSRSYRKRPAFKIFGKSDKKDKRFANKKLRRAVRMGNFDLTIRDVSDTWGFKSDGLARWQGEETEERWLRK